jgi:O-antigen/teichoic acid export membrane protein
LPLGISLFCNGALIQQDILLLKHFTDDTQIGLFSAGYRIVMAIVTFITPAFAVLLPEFSRKAAQSHSDVSVLGGKVAQLFLAAVIPGVVLLAVIAKPLLVFLYGSPFAAAAPVLHFLAAVIFLRSLEYLFDVGLISVNRPWWVLVGAGSSLVVNVVLNLLWIPKWGFMGAVYAKLAAEIVVFGSAFVLFQIAVRGSFFPKWITRPIIAGMVFLAAMHFSRSLGTTVSFVIGLGAYIITFSILAWSVLRSLLSLDNNKS